MISVKMHCNFIEITLLHGRPPVNLLHICRKPFSEEHLWGLLLNFSRRHIIDIGAMSRV